MDKLPKDWVQIKLGDFCTVVRGSSPRPQGDPKYYGGDVPRLMVADVTRDGKYVIPQIDFLTLEGAKLSRPIKEGSLTIQVSGNPGTPAILGCDACIHDGFAALKDLNTNKINIEYLFYFLLCSKSKHSELAAGAIFRNIKTDHIRDFQIPLPPLPEQSRIVSKLEALFARIDKSITLLEENIKHTNGLMASVLEKVFRDAESKWKYKSLKLITSKIGSGSTPRGGQDSYKTSGMSLIRSMNIHDGEFRHKGLALIDDEQAKKLANVEVKKDDVLLNITGASVARCSIVDASILPARVNQHVSIIRPTSELNPYFLQAFLISPDTKSKLLSDSGGGATREAITKSMIENLEVPVPDIKIQKIIINYIQKIKEANSKIILEQQSKLAYLKALKSSILDRAFKGEL